MNKKIDCEVNKYNAIQKKSRALCNFQLNVRGEVRGPEKEDSQAVLYFWSYGRGTRTRQERLAGGVLIFIMPVWARHAARKEKTAIFSEISNLFPISDKKVRINFLCY